MAAGAKEMKKTDRKYRYGMVIDLDACTGCGACMVACAAENNVAPAPAKVSDRTSITLMRVFEVKDPAPMPARKTAFIPMMCMQCDDPPCEHVCPQQAVELDVRTGIVDQMVQRCFGCRYCMAACPYHARYFNWFDPEWPEGMEQTLNPAVAPKMRGAVLEGSDSISYKPACSESCPAQAIRIGDLNNPDDPIQEQIRKPETFQFLVKLGTKPKMYYQSKHDWVKRLSERASANGNADRRNS
jgi:molybdopterin-containing oxidoreductase family iron-sulfur binding subunit